MVDLGIYTISSIEQAEELLMAESTIVLGFFDSLEVQIYLWTLRKGRFHISVI